MEEENDCSAAQQEAEARLKEWALCDQKNEAHQCMIDYCDAVEQCGYCIKCMNALIRNMNKTNEWMKQVKKSISKDSWDDLCKSQAEAKECCWLSEPGIKHLDDCSVLSPDVIVERARARKREIDQAAINQLVARLTTMLAIVEASDAKAAAKAAETGEASECWAE